MSSVRSLEREHTGRLFWGEVFHQGKEGVYWT
jgi:hypothetical protein